MLSFMICLDGVGVIFEEFLVLYSMSALECLGGDEVCFIYCM